MKTLNLLSLTSLLALAATLSPATSHAASCSSATAATHHVALSLPAAYHTSIDFAGDNANPHVIPPGTFDPVAMLTQTISLSNLLDTRPVCLIAHLSTLNQVADNALFMQVTVDGVPMQGHAIYGIAPVPVVLEVNHTVNDTAIGSNGTPDRLAVDYPQMSSYTFFSSVSGNATHKIEVHTAGCCSGTTGNNETGTVVLGATLVLDY